MFKQLKDFFRLIISKFNKNLPEVDPSIEPSFGNTIAVSSSAIAVSLQDGIKDAMNQMFLDSCDIEFLKRHAAKDGIDQLESTQSQGDIAVNGIASTVVAINTSVVWNGFTYLTTAESTVQNYTGDISLSYSGGIVTAVSDSEHSLSSGLTITISGAVQSDYNGEFTILEIIDENTFTYELDAGALSENTGSYSADYVILNIKSQLTGKNKNIESGTAVNISYTDIETIGYVGLSGIIGGYDIEDVEDFRSRAKDARIAVKGENAPQMIISARKIVGNTRVIIFRPVLDAVNGTRGYAGYLPRPGETVIYILRDNETDIIPNSTVLSNTKQQILDDGLWSTKNIESALMVLAPNKKHLTVVISNLLPNTDTMKNSIWPALKIFCRDNFKMKKADDVLSGIIKLDDLKQAIRNIKDIVTGEMVADFDINLISDIQSDFGEIYTAESGDVTFS